MGMEPEYSAILPAPFGAVGVALQDNVLTGLDCLPPGTSLRLGHAEIALELQTYFANPGHRFDLPVKLAGTPFRRRVWQALLMIPPGETRPYGELAAQLASRPRAVGQAVADNPIAIIVPCHRVLAAHGLGGFMHGRDGFPIDVKKWLLRHEGIDI